MIKDQSITEFMDNLASAASTPGGGSAAAILGAMGAALTSMVCNLTIGKKGYEDVSEDLKQVREDDDALRHQLLEMIQDDVDAFDGVMGAYGLPKETDDERAERSAIQRAMSYADSNISRTSELLGVTRPTLYNLIKKHGMA
jgi:formiminotetrahydrofolate cyclodeaminase